MITKVIRQCCIAVSVAACAGVALAGPDRVVVTGLFRDRAVLDVDGAVRMLRIGESSPEGVKLVSADSRAAVVEIDGTQRQLTLGDHIQGTFSAPDAGASITIAPDAQGMYLVPGSVNGFHVQFVVDTGATRVSMNRDVAKRLGINFKLDGLPSRASTAAGIVPIWLVELDRVRIGDIELRDVQASVHDADYPVQVLLGNSFLTRVHLEREGRLLRLTKP